jgi:hypothetical protein
VAILIALNQNKSFHSFTFVLYFFKNFRCMVNLCYMFINKIVARLGVVSCNHIMKRTHTLDVVWQKKPYNSIICAQVNSQLFHASFFFQLCVLK